MKKTGVRDQESEVDMAGDGLLENLADAMNRLARVEADIEAEMEEVRAKYAAALRFYQRLIQESEHSLMQFMKQNRDELFADKDKVELLHGLLLYARGPHVSIPRNALGKIEEMGWIEAVRVAKSVARDVVQQWPDERLEVIGAKRTIKETYSYELAA